jgi:hypothetical protein
MRPTILAVGFALALAGPALAQNSNAQNQNAQRPQPNAQQPNAQSPRQNSQSLRQEVQNNLPGAGFTDIRIMAESFLVRAKDRSGNPVMMVINPDSITAVTEVPATTGSAPNSNSGNTNNRGQGGSPR